MQNRESELDQAEYTHAIQIENRCSIELIPEPLWPAINQAKGLYHEVFGSHLQSIYL